MMMTIPEKKCTSIESFEKGDCSMCPRGKTFNQFGGCTSCQSDQFFNEDFENYFKSACKYCPLGTVGG
jgi:hypothetical protein